MLNKREREREFAFKVIITISHWRGGGEVGDTKFLRPNVWDFNIISTMKNKNNSYRAVRHHWVNISI